MAIEVSLFRDQNLDYHKCNVYTRDDDKNVIKRFFFVVFSSETS